MSSMTGRVLYPFAGPNSAWKFQTSIWQKHLSIRRPPPGRSPSGDRRLYGDGLAADSRMVRGLMNGGLPPGRVAETVARALTSRRPRTRYLVGADARAMALASRLLPDSVRDMLVARVMKLPSSGRDDGDV